MTEEEKKALQDGAAVITNKTKEAANSAVNSVKKFYKESDFSNPEYRKDLAEKAKRGFKGFLHKVGKKLEDLGTEEEQLPAAETTQETEQAEAEDTAEPEPKSEDTEDTEQQQ